MLLSDPAHEMRLLVTGGRNYNNRAMVFRSLDRLTDTHVAATGADRVLVIHGGCCEPGQPLVLRGADRWADEWAKEREYPHIAVPARWGIHGNGAGPIRNRMMLEHFHPTNIVAFTGGRGTANMVDIARKAGLIVWFPDDTSIPPRRSRRE